MSKIVYEYKRKDSKTWPSTRISMKAETESDILNQFSSIEDYFGKFVSGGVVILKREVLNG